MAKKTAIKPKLDNVIKMFQLYGFRVITASDGIDAVAKFRNDGEMIDLKLMETTHHRNNCSEMDTVSNKYEIDKFIKGILYQVAIKRLRC